MSAAEMPGVQQPLSVFVSYAHADDQHQGRVLALANRLRGDGIDAILDLYVQSPPEGWPLWMERHLRTSSFVLAVCDRTYYSRVQGFEDRQIGRGVKWEGKLIYQYLYTSEDFNQKAIPVLLGSANESDIPEPLRGATFYRADTERGYEDLYRHITHQPSIVKPPLGKPKALQSKTGEGYEGKSGPGGRSLRVFLCYSSDNKATVRALALQLRTDGFETWLDEEQLLLGQDWSSEIRRALRASDVVLVCLSQHATEKRGYLQREIREALDVAEEQPDGTIFLIPVLLEACDVPERLRRWQSVNIFEDDGYERLVAALRLRGQGVDTAFRTPVMGRLGILADVLKLPNVVGVDIAPRIIAGQVSPEFSVRVIVSKKLPLDRLRKDDIIPSSIGGIPVDVVEAGGVTVNFDAGSRAIQFPIHMDELGEFARALKIEGFDAGVDLFNGQVGLTVGPKGLDKRRLRPDTRALFFPLWEINAHRNRDLVDRRAFHDIMDERPHDWKFNKPYP